MPVLEICEFAPVPGKLYFDVPTTYGYLMDLGGKVLDWQEANGREIDTVVGSPKGGLEVVSCVSQMLELSGNKVQGLTLNTREGDKQTGEIVRGQMPEAEKIYGKVVLWLDDVRHTGVTEDKADLLITAEQPELLLRGDIAYKPKQDIAKPKRPPDFYAMTTEEWIVFPWERWAEYAQERSNLIKLGATEKQLNKLKANYLAAIGVGNIAELKRITGRK